jgi:hypothetical protein
MIAVPTSLSSSVSITPSTVTSSIDRADWNPTLVNLFVDSLMAMVPYRTAEGNSFKPQEWSAINSIWLVEKIT